MILKDCHDLVKAYIEWLRQKISVEDIVGVCEITTPFVDRHNDQLQIYVKPFNNRLILTDDGYTIKDLKISGFEITTEKRREILYSILNGFGVQLHGDELTVEATQDNFAQKKHNLIQTMLAVNDLWAMTEPMVASLFREDVERYLRMHQIRFTPSFKFAGKSGLDHSFDFVIPASPVKPERILNAISNPTRQTISLLIFSWTEIAEVRARDSTAYGVLNDTEKQVSPDLISALQQYRIRPMQWSRRDEYVEELAS
ncbi:MAG: hypothetical protein DDT40_01907 [candidate division WS2 bacterium]|nr:hypothetical protein [Candidatus Psychracetigena formicireducens]